MAHYPLRPLRRALSLDGAWDFAWLGSCDPAGLDPARVACAETAAVPGVFDGHGVRPGAHGVGLYRRRIEVPAPGLWRLEIGALGLRGRVWWDGRPVAEAPMAYSPVVADLACGAGCHELAIAVDNRFDAQASPLFPPHADFHAHGGIYRSVMLQELPALRIERVVVTTLDAATGRVRLDIRLGGAVPDELVCTVAFDDAAGAERPARIRDGRIALEMQVPDPRPWSPERPDLHTVRVCVAGDAIIERFGLRTVAARDGSILVNGVPVRLRGVNRHEAHPQFGPVQPGQLLADDVALLRDLGCTFVRTVHYPHDQRFLDLCDRHGLLVWSESLAWGLDAAAMTAPEARSQLMAQTVRMVEDGINHPSVIMWGFLNECASDAAEARPVYAELAQAVRRADPGRLVTYASNRPSRDRCFDLVDVIAVNLYPGWIWPQADWPATPAGSIAPFVSAVADALHAIAAGRPLLLSEIGACAMPGCHDRAAAQWSEEFQAGYMAEACRVVRSDPRWCGLALWQFCDTRSYAGHGDVRCKPRGMNNAGLLDEYRRPKLAYDAVRAAFADFSRT